MLEFLISPGAVIGCIVGIGVGALLHWAFPLEDLSLIQALAIVLLSVAGLIVEHTIQSHHKKSK